jgi:uncharacterized membrane protein YbhN (UPF0104 family)
MPDPRPHRLKTVLGIVASVAIAGVALYVLYRTFQRISLADVIANIRAMPGERLLLAACCALGAFATLAAYEIIAVRYVRRGIGIVKPVVTALIAFPLGHALGQTVLSGGAVRYRMYAPAGMSAMEVGATVLLVGMPYVLAFGLLLDLALVFAAEQLAPAFRISAQWLFVLGCIGLAKDAAYLLFVHLRKAPIRLGGWSVQLPSLRMTLLQVTVGLVDICLIASVLYLLLPPGSGIAFLPFVAVYLSSIVVGVLSHVPAGLGVLESMLLLLLPQVPPEQLLAAVLLYRVIYEVVPLVLAVLLWGGYELVARDGARVRLLAPRPGADPPA